MNESTASKFRGGGELRFISIPLYWAKRWMVVGCAI